MPHSMSALLKVALTPDATPAEIAATPLSETMRAALVRKDEVEVFEGLPARRKDPRTSLHVDEAPLWDRARR